MVYHCMHVTKEITHCMQIKHTAQLSSMAVCWCPYIVSPISWPACTLHFHCSAGPTLYYQSCFWSSFWSLIFGCH